MQQGVVQEGNDPETILSSRRNGIVFQKEAEVREYTEAGLRLSTTDRPV